MAAFLKRLCWRRPPETARVVRVGNSHLPQDEVAPHDNYPDNTVVSSKYTLLTFLPKNLFEQFRRIANFYFLCVVIIQLLIDTPVTPVTSIIPLVFVISTTAFKQGYEDWLRHKADKEVNLRPTTIIRNGTTEDGCRAMDIKVGDIVKVLINEEFPCDLVLLSSADKQGLCYVTTANLDGETNLKTHYCVNETKRFQTLEELGQIRASITCQPPLADLYIFEGVVEFSTNDVESKPLGPENILLRGARLKNTEYVFACAVYTGKDTKVALNSKFKQNKFSRVERKMNTFLLIFLAVLLLEIIIMTSLKYWYVDKYGTPSYVPPYTEDQSSFVKVIENGLAFMVLFNYIIPISLYVTVELQKFLGSMLFGWDLQMYDDTINERALANTSDLNEELGQVEYLFTDKTGTLTENTMAFRRCFAGGRQLEEIDGELCERLHPEIKPKPITEYTSDMDLFLRVLVLCHTVRIDYKEDISLTEGASSIYSSTGFEYLYQASSPDEKALIEACCRYGVIYHGMQEDMMEVTFHKVMRRFKLLHTLPFDATRKRMSVIVQDEEGEIFLLCKGAEIAILDRVVAGDIVTTQRLIDQYAVLGLRTLTIAERHFQANVYEAVNRKIMDAKRSLDRREEKLSMLYDELEQDFTLLGATAVEDKLQDAVPETIQSLRDAGIKVWVLTGDKEETAVNISHAAGHFHPGMTELKLTQVTSQEQCQEQISHLTRVVSTPETEEHALIIDGKSLKYAINLNRKSLRNLCSMCVAVLCCRMSPIQKAEVVSLIQTSDGKPVTAAIGDGANDVSMIQEADVGLGIMGKEGRQAAMNSDYAFGKFKFLQRALLFHGHLYYNRIAILVQYFFYKNVAFITSQLIYACFNSFSQQSLFDPFFLMLYNMTFTSLPILLYGLFEQHKPQEELLNHPKHYKAISRNATLSWSQFAKWMSLGLWHCCVFFFGTVFLNWQDSSLFKSGVGIGNYDMGTIIVYTCVFTVNIKLMLETHYWCWPIIISYVITFLALAFVSILYTAVFWPSQISSQNNFYCVLEQLLASGAVWLGILLLIFLALLPDICLKTLKDFRWMALLRHRFNREIVQLTKVHQYTTATATMGGRVTSQHPPEMGMSTWKLIDNIELHGSKVASDFHAFAYDNPIPVQDSPTEQDETSQPPTALPSPKLSRHNHQPAQKSLTAVTEAPQDDLVNNLPITTWREGEAIILESSHL